MAAGRTLLPEYLGMAGQQVSMDAIRRSENDLAVRFKRLVFCGIGSFSDFLSSCFSRRRRIPENAIVNYNDRRVSLGNLGL